jgi:hypothetical protein
MMLVLHVVEDEPGLMLFKKKKALLYSDSGCTKLSAVLVLGQGSYCHNKELGTQFHFGLSNCHMHSGFNFKVI